MDGENTSILVQQASVCSKNVQTELITLGFLAYGADFWVFILSFLYSNQNFKLGESACCSREFNILPFILLSYFWEWWDFGLFQIWTISKVNVRLYHARVLKLKITESKHIWRCKKNANFRYQVKISLLFFS